MHLFNSWTLSNSHLFKAISYFLTVFGRLGNLWGNVHTCDTRCKSVNTDLGPRSVDSTCRIRSRFISKRFYLVISSLHIYSIRKSVYHIYRGQVQSRDFQIVVSSFCFICELWTKKVVYFQRHTLLISNTHTVRVSCLVLHGENQMWYIKNGVYLCMIISVNHILG